MSESITPLYPLKNRSMQLSFKEARLPDLSDALLTSFPSLRRSPRFELIDFKECYDCRLIASLEKLLWNTDTCSTFFFFFMLSRSLRGSTSSSCLNLSPLDTPLVILPLFLKLAISVNFLGLSRTGSWEAVLDSSWDCFSIFSVTVVWLDLREGAFFKYLDILVWIPRGSMKSFSKLKLLLSLQ